MSVHDFFSHLSNDLLSRDAKIELVNSVYPTLIKQYYVSKSTEEHDDVIRRDKLHHLSLLFTMIAYVRDIVAGQGEYALSFAMLMVWYRFFPEDVYYLLETFVENQNRLFPSDPPFGCWKDMKLIASLLRNQGCGDDHPLISKLVNMTNARLRDDLIILRLRNIGGGRDGGGDHDNHTDDYADHDDGGDRNCAVSLVAKWIPREASEKHGWFFMLLAEEFFDCYLRNVPPPTNQKEDHRRHQAAKSRAYMHYRKTVAALNHVLDTPQIKFCANQWSKLDFTLMSTITQTKNWAAIQNFLNMNTNMNTNTNTNPDQHIRYPNRIDRVECSRHFRNFMDAKRERNNAQLQQHKRCYEFQLHNNSSPLPKETMCERLGHNPRYVGLKEYFYAAH